MQHDKNQQGLTLLELMVTVAIVGLLLTLAIPNYQRYTQRAKFTEVIQAIAPYKIAVTLCAYQQGDLSLCQTPGQNGIPDNFKAKNSKQGYVDQILVQENGVITAQSQQITLDKCHCFTYTLKPSLQENTALLWTVDKSKQNSCKRFNLC